MAEEAPAPPVAASEAAALTPAPAGPSYWSRQRLELLAWFDQRAPHLGALYKSGVMLLMDERIPARAMLIAHSVREVGNRLPNVIGITRVASTTKRINLLAKTWEQCGLPTDFTVPLTETAPGSADTPTCPIPQPAAQAIAELLRDHVSADERALDNAILLLREISPGSRFPVEQLRPTASKWVKVMKWFQKRVHAGEEPRIVPEDELRENFETYEALLGSMLRPFFSTLKEVDDLLEEANS